jgi:hypothetical protein
MSVSENRKSRVEAPPTVSKSHRSQRRRIEAAMLHGRPFKVQGTEGY